MTGYYSKVLTPLLRQIYSSCINNIPSAQTRIPTLRNVALCGTRQFSQVTSDRPRWPQGTSDRLWLIHTSTSVWNSSLFYSTSSSPLLKRENFSQYPYYHNNAGVFINKRYFSFKRKGSPGKKNKKDEIVDESKLGLLQRFKLMYKQYWYVLVPVHAATSVVWYGGFFIAAKSGVDIVPILMWFGVTSETILGHLNDGNTGYYAIAYAMYKLATPVRYTLTLGCTTVSINYLKNRGYIKPVPSKEKLQEMYDNKREQAKEIRETMENQTKEFRENFEQQKNELKEKLEQRRVQMKQNLPKSPEDMGKQLNRKSKEIYKNLDAMDKLEDLKKKMTANKGFKESVKRIKEDVKAKMQDFSSNKDSSDPKKK